MNHPDKPLMKPNSLSETLIIQYRYTGFTFAATLKDLTEEQALNQPEPGDNCINWVAGHLVQTRGITLSLLGLELPFASNKYDRYKRSSEPVQNGQTNNNQTIPLQEILTDFSATRKPLQAGLQSLTQEHANTPAPFSPFNNENETVGSLLAGMFFHESYHVGQLGLLRRLAGAESIIK